MLNNCSSLSPTLYIVRLYLKPLLSDNLDALAIYAADGKDAAAEMSSGELPTASSHLNES